MKNKLGSSSHQLTAAALMTALGLVLPYATAHMFGVPGTVLLPMHLPILLCGLLCGPKYGVLCAIVTPVISSVLTGMPPAYPMLPIMLATLIGFALVGGLAYRHFRLPIYPSLILAMICGWGFYALAFQALFLAGGGNLRALTVTAALAAGVPGIIAQLLLVPFLVKRLEKYLRIPKALPVEKSGQVITTVQTIQKDEEKLSLIETKIETNKLAEEKRGADMDEKARILGVEPELLAEACKMIKAEGTSCVMIKEGSIIHTADGRGVAPLLAIYEKEREKLAASCVVDRIIGKAAAMILVLGGAKSVYGEIMSKAAREYLESRDIPCQYGLCVDVITGRSGTGICPIESSVLSIDDPAEGFEALTKRLAELRKAM